MGMAVLAALIGATMIGIHSWSIDMYQPLIADCKMYDSINSTLPNSTVTIGEEYPDIFEPVKICESLNSIELRGIPLNYIWREKIMKRFNLIILKVTELPSIH
jgi:hypothetical protein